MANTIKLKKSSVTGKAPLVSDLDYGELAINYADEKLYFKNASNTIKSFTVGGGGSQAIQNRYSYTATAGQTTFLATYSVGFVDVFVNGVKLVDGVDYTATNGTSVVLTTAADLNDAVDVIGYVATALNLEENLQQRYSYTATEGQTTFNASYIAPFVDVYKNGTRLVSGVGYTATNGSTVVLAAGATAGDSIEIIGYTSYTNTINGTPSGLVYLDTLGNFATSSSMTFNGSTLLVSNLSASGTISGTYNGTLQSSQVTGALGYTPENLANKNAANGYAGLDGAGLIPSSILPSYVDDVLEYSSLANFPVTGETGKIYIALDTNKTYRWSGSTYIYITSGAVDSVAGKTGVVTLTNSDVGLGNVENKSSATIRGEITSGNVTTALGYTPYNSTNPNGYTSNTGTVTSIAGTGTVSGLTLSGTVTGSGNLTLGGTLSLTSTQVTDGLGYTPYNSTNPSGYITSSGSITGNAATATSATTAGTITGQANSATITATTANAANSIVLRDGSGNFNAGIISAGQFSGPVVGNVTGTASGNLALTGGSMTGLLIGRESIGTNVNTMNDSGSFSVRSNAANAASISFHRTGAYAINMGVGTDNVFVIGGWSASANAFRMDGSGNLTMLANVTAYSDERVKTNWRDLRPDFIERLAEVKHGIYDRIDQVSTQVGVSAQSLQNVLEHAVMADAKGHLSVAYGNAALVAAVKLAERVVALEARLAAIEAKDQT